MTFEEVKEAMEIIRGVMDEVRPINISIAQKAVLSTEMILETGHQGAITHAMISGMSRELSREYTRMRRASRRASEQVIRNIESLDRLSSNAIRQLSFPIVSPGSAPTPLSGSHHVLIKSAYFYEARQLRGRERNVDLLAHYTVKTAPWPDTPVGVLIDRGDLTVEDLVLPDKSGTKSKSA